MRYFLFIMILALSMFAYASDKELVDAVNKLQKETTFDNNTYKDKINDTYDSMKKRIVVPEVQIPDYNIFKESQSNILKGFNLPEAKNIIPDIDNESSCYDSNRLGSYRIFVFISSSIPETTLKNFMRDAFVLKDALLVLRGVIGSADFIKPTQNFITQLSCGKNAEDLKPTDDCNVSRVDINPLLFTLFNIERVPAIVYSNLSYQELMIRANTGKSVSQDEYFIIHGDMELSYALEKFEKAGADSLQSSLKLLRGEY